MLKYHVGIDLHKTVAQICVLDADGEIKEERRFQIPDRQAGDVLVAWLGQWAAEGHFAVEAVGVNRWFVHACRAAGYDVLVVHAAQMDLRKAGKKTDKRDAREIARRLRLGDLHRHARTYYPSDEEYGVRQLLRYRHAQVNRRKQVESRIRAMLNTHLIRPPLRTLAGKKSLAWLKEVELPTEEETFVLRMMIPDLEALKAQIATLDQRIGELRAVKEVATLEAHLPSIAVLSAANIVFELGDVTRFESSKQVAAYAGAVPTVHQSGEGKAHHGRITKQGNRLLRWTLTQWAVRLLTTHPVARAWAQGRARNLTSNKRRIALARRLLVGVYRMLRWGEVFSLERCLGERA